MRYMKKLFISLILAIFLVSFVSSAEWDNSLDNGLIRYWNLDETGSPKIDLVNGKEINLVGNDVNGLYSSEGLYGGSWLGNNDSYGETTYLDEINGELTYSVWFRVLHEDNWNDGYLINFLHGSPNFLIQLADCSQSLPRIAIEFNGQSCLDTPSDLWIEGIDGWKNKEWIHLVFTAKSGEQMKIYIDGVLVANKSAGTFTSFGNSSTMGFIGSFYEPEYYYSLNNEGIDEIAIWDIELTEEQVGILYADGEGMTKPSQQPEIPTSTIPKNIFQIQCQSGDSLCKILEGAGAGIGVLIKYVLIPAIFLILVIVVVGFVYLIIHAIFNNKLFKINYTKSR